MTPALIILAIYLLALAAIFYGVRAGWFDPAGPYVVEATGTTVRLSDGRSFAVPAGKVFFPGETITARPAQPRWIKGVTTYAGIPIDELHVMDNMRQHFPGLSTLQIAKLAEDGDRAAGEAMAWAVWGWHEMRLGLARADLAAAYDRHEREQGA